MENVKDPIKRKQLYDFLKENDLVKSDYDTFSNKYAEDGSSAQLYSFLKDNKLTQKNEQDFHAEYFGDLKKKEESQPTSPDKDLVSEQKVENGSLATPQNETPPNDDRGQLVKDIDAGKFDGRIKQLEEENQETTENDQRHLNTLLERYKNDTSFNTGDFEDVNQTIEDENNGDFGFMNKFKEIASRAWTGQKPLTPKQIEVNKIKERISKEQNIPLEDVDVSLAENQYIQKRKNELSKAKKEAKTEEFIEALSEEDKKTLTNYFSIKSGSLRASLTSSLLDIETKSKEVQNINKEIDEIKANHDDTKNDYPLEYYQRNQQLEQQKEVLKQEVNTLVTGLGENQEDLLSTQEELDLFKRNYGTWENFSGKLGIASEDLALNLQYLLNKVDSIDPFMSKESFEADEARIIKDKQALERKRNTLRKGKRVGDINSVEDLTEWALDLVAEQTPNTVLMATTGGASLPLMGATAAGGKLYDLEDEERRGESDYTGLEKYSSALLTGTFEALTEKISLGQIGKAKRVFSSVAKKELKDNTVDYLKKNFPDYVKDILEEGGSEALSQFGENITDRYLLGKDVSLTEGLDDAFFSGAFMSGVVYKMPGIAKAVTQPFTPKDTNQKIGENINLVLKLNQELQKDLKPETKDKILIRKDKLLQENKDLLDKTIDNVDKLDSKQKGQLIAIENETYKLRKEAKSINEDALDKSTKEVLLNDISDNIHKLESKKESILNPQNKSDAKTEEATQETKEQEVEATTPETEVETKEKNDAINSENNDNFVNNEYSTKQDSEARLDNGSSMESSSKRELVGERAGSEAVYLTAEASNNGGSEDAVLSIEEREELESRGINPDWNKSKFKNNLKENAQKNGVWLDDTYLSDKTELHNHKKDNTTENDVYLNSDGKSVTKVNNLSFVTSGETENNISAFLDRIETHNLLFPDSKYTIIGYKENNQKETSMVLEQPYIDAERNATKEEISNYLEEQGFKLDGVRKWSNGKQVWSNGSYELYDARPANVLKGKDGNLYFFDTVPHSVAYMNASKNKTNETQAQGNTVTDANVQSTVERNLQQGKSDTVSPIIESRPSKGEVEVGVETEAKNNIDHAVKEINKGVLAWDGNPFSSRIDLGISRADVRKGEADIKKGNYNTAPAKRVIEALAKAKKQGYYDYMEGSGGKTRKIQVPLTEQLDVDTELSVQELEEINQNEDALAKQHEEFFNNLDEATQNEILENYENSENNSGEVQSDTEIGKSKNDVSDKQETKPKTKAERIKIANAKVDDIANAIKGIDEIFGVKIKVDNIDGLTKNGVDIVDVIAKIAKKAIEAGIEIDVAIQKTIEHLKKNLDFEVDVNDVKAKLQSKKDTTPPNTPKDNSKKPKGPNKKRTKISERFIKADNQKLVSGLVESLGLNDLYNNNKSNWDKAAEKLGSVEYEVRRQEGVYNKAKKFVDKVGVFSAYKAITDGTIEQDDTRNAVYAIILEQQAKTVIDITETAKNEKEAQKDLSELGDFFQEVFEAYNLATVNAGQGISMIAYLHRKGHFLKYDLSNQIALERQRNGGEISTKRLKELKERDTKIKELEAKIKELQEQQDKAIAQGYFDDAIAFENWSKKRTKKISKSQAKKLASKVRKLKFTQDLSDLAKLQSSPLGVITGIYDGALETFATVLEKTGDLELAIRKGLNIIKRSEWYKKLDAKGQKLAQQKWESQIDEYTNEDIEESNEGDTIKVVDGEIKISRKVLRELVEEGITDINIASKTLKERNAELLENFTIREIRDALTNYGKTIEMDQSDIARTVRQMKRLGVLDSKIEDAKKGIRPSKTGLQRDKTTPLERERNKLLDDLLDKLPIDEVDLQNKIKTRVDKRIQTLKNAIEDLDLQIKNGKRNERTVKKPVTNDKIKALEAKRKAKQEELTELVGKPERTLEQRLQTRKNQIDRQIKKIEDDIANNDIGFAKKKTPVTDTEIEQKLDELKVLKERRAELRESQGIIEEQRLQQRKKAIARAIEQRRQRIKNKDFAPRKPKPLKPDAELLRLQRENAKLKELYDKEAEKDRLKKRHYTEIWKDSLLGLWNAFRQAVLTAEMSFIGIQGYVLMADKTFTRKNIKNVAKSVKNIDRSKLKSLKSTTKVAGDILGSIESLKVLGKALHSTVNETVQKNAEIDLKNHPRYEMAKKYVQLIEIDNGLQDEHFVGVDFINDIANIIVTKPATIAERAIRKKLNRLKPGLSLKEQDAIIAETLVKLNPLNALERGNARFLNELRFNEFVLGVELLENQGKTVETHPKDYKSLGMMVNTVTGTSTLSPVLKQSIPVINAMFLAFRFTVSMANQSVLAPIYFARISGQKGRISYAQKRYLKLMGKSYGLMAATVYGVYMASMASWLGDDEREEDKKPRIEFDPRSSDFMNVIEGNTAINVLGSRKKHIVLLSQLFTGERKNKSGEIVKNGQGFNSMTDFDITSNYIVNHLNIIPRYAVNWLRGSDEIIEGETKRVIKYGSEIEDVSIKTQFLGTYPLIIDTYKELLEEEPYLLKSYMIASFFGQQISIYDRTKKEKRKKPTPPKPPKPKTP